MATDEELVAARWRRSLQAVKVDLAQHLSVCELNYHVFLSLLPDIMAGREDWSYALGLRGEFTVHIRLLENSPYTSLIELHQQGRLALGRIQVRLYHDAELAEVVAWERHRHWQSRYEYPNPRMYQPDEKLALNRFIGEWLAFCRKTGYVLAANCE